MFNLSDNYYLRKCYFQQEQAPTQSMIKKKMTPPLAAVYFKYMTPRLKVIAGLEPSLKGGGNDWYVPPKELLEGRAVLKPVKKKVLAKLNHDGIDIIGTKIFQKHRKALDIETEKRLLESDINWRNTVTNLMNQEAINLAEVAAKNNTQHIVNDFNHFTRLYRHSLNKTEALFHEAVIADILRNRENALHKMQNNYKAALKYQATELYDKYEKKLMEEKSRLKAEFVQKIELYRQDLGDKLHDLNVDKHATIEQLKQFLKCQNLACQIYVALKEREECLKEIKETKHKHQKKVKILTDNIAIKDLKIHHEKQKVKERQELITSWHKKVCHVVKSLQTFVSYCLNILPEHAEFFVNMEKLMLLQVNKALENPSAPSIITEVESEQFHTPVPLPKPFYLFCDRGYKAQIDCDLCPRHNGTFSNTSHLPAIIINKRCLYAACNNFEQFTKKIKDFIYGNRGDDADMKDDLVYESFVPVKYTSSQQLLELKLESSLLQVLQQEIAYMDGDIICNYCGMPVCSCTQRDSLSVAESNKTKQASSLETKSSGAVSRRFSSNVRSMKLDYDREPNWESFCRYVQPKQCICSKTAKKHLVEYFPVYMRHMKYGPPDIPDYEMCSITTLKALVKQSRKQLPPISPVGVLSKSKDISTQCISDPEFEKLCTCFSDNEIDRLYSKLDLTNDPELFDPVLLSEGKYGSRVTPSYISQQTNSFAAARAYSLRNLLEELPDLKVIFSRKDQVNDAIEDPTAECVIAVEEEQFHTPVPKPVPYYLFCDKGYKAKVDQGLCSKYSCTSSASQLPVIIVNKRCIYNACDNFEQFTSKIKDYIHGNQEDDADIKDDLVYEHFVPVKYTQSQQLSEIKLESSLLQILQQEMSNIKKMPPACCTIPNCFCVSHEDTEKPNNTSEKITEQGPLRLLPSHSTSNKGTQPLTNITLLEHEREPKLERYIKYTEPKTCECTKSCKKHLAERLPVYMRKMSMYDALELPNYEKCSVTTLKKLVKEAGPQRTPPIVVKMPPKTTDMCTQYSNEEFDLACTCFSHSNKHSFEPAKTDDRFDLEKFLPSYMTSRPSSFVVDRAYSLRQLIDDAPELIEIFNKKK